MRGLYNNNNPLFFKNFIMSKKTELIINILSLLIFQPVGLIFMWLQGYFKSFKDFIVALCTQWVVFIGLEFVSFLIYGDVLGYSYPRDVIFTILMNVGISGAILYKYFIREKS
jgi:hypothetical protein